MKKAYNNCLHRYIKLVLKPGLIMELILICILVSIHGYTDSVTDNRWALYDFDNLLCADTFVVTACLVIMGLVIRDYYLSIRKYILEERAIDIEKDIEGDDNPSILEQLPIGCIYTKLNRENIVCYSDYVKKHENKH